jgi:hypothetical protein
MKVKEIKRRTEGKDKQKEKSLLRVKNSLRKREWQKISNT